MTDNMAYRGTSYSNHLSYYFAMGAIDVVSMQNFQKFWPPPSPLARNINLCQRLSRPPFWTATTNYSKQQIGLLAQFDWLHWIKSLCSMFSNSIVFMMSTCWKLKTMSERSMVFLVWLCVLLQLYVLCSFSFPFEVLYEGEPFWSSVSLVV